MNKYSAEELDVFKALILRKIKSATKILNEQKEIMGDFGSNDTLDTSWQHKGVDDAPTYNFKEEANIIASNQISLIQDLKLALERINSGTYGICIESGELIPKGRLMVMPQALKSVFFKIEEEKN